MVSTDYSLRIWILLAWRQGHTSIHINTTTPYSEAQLENQAHHQLFPWQRRSNNGLETQ